MEFKSFQLNGVTMSIFLCTKGDIYWNIGIKPTAHWELKRFQLKNIAIKKKFQNRPYGC